MYTSKLYQSRESFLTNAAIKLDIHRLLLRPPILTCLHEKGFPDFTIHPLDLIFTLRDQNVRIFAAVNAI